MRDVFATVILLWLLLAIGWPEWAGKEFGEKTGSFVRSFVAAHSAKVQP